MSAPDVAAVLAAHMSTRGRAERIHPADGPNCGWAIVRVCKCGEWSAPVMHDDSDKVAHRAHVAEALKPVIAAAQTEAWDEGWRAAVRSPYTAPGTGENPYRGGAQ